MMQSNFELFYVDINSGVCMNRTYWLTLQDAFMHIKAISMVAPCNSVQINIQKDGISKKIYSLQRPFSILN